MPTTLAASGGCMRVDGCKGYSSGRLEARDCLLPLIGVSLEEKGNEVT